MGGQIREHTALTIWGDSRPRGMEIPLVISPAKITRGSLVLLAVFGSIILALAAPAAASTPAPNIVSTFQNAGTGLCLNNTAATPVNPSIVQGSVCNDQLSEVWSFAGSNNASVLRNVATGSCLTSNSIGDVSTTACGSTTVHEWFVAGSGGPVRDVMTGRCLEDLPVDSGIITNVIRTAPCSDISIEHWIHS